MCLGYGPRYPAMHMLCPALTHIYQHCLHASLREVPSKRLECWFCALLTVAALVPSTVQSNYLWNVAKISMCVCAQSLSGVWLFAAPQTVANQVPLSMKFCRWEYCSGLWFPAPGDFLDSEIKPESLALKVVFFTVPSGKPQGFHSHSQYICRKRWGKLLDMNTKML